jgi:Cu+-exporting ATPase
VNLAAERAHVRYRPGEVDVDRLITTMMKTGFTADVSTADTRAEEKAKKLALYREELRRFWIAAALTLPLVAQMAFMFGSGAHDDVLPRWLQLLLATPVQFWIGWRFTQVPGMRCAGAVRTWTSWSPWAPAQPICSAPP